MRYAGPGRIVTLCAKAREQLGCVKFSTGKVWEFPRQDSQPWVELRRLLQGYPSGTKVSAVSDEDQLLFARLLRHRDDSVGSTRQALVRYEPAPMTATHLESLNLPVHERIAQLEAKLDALIERLSDDDDDQVVGGVQSSSLVGGFIDRILGRVADQALERVLAGMGLAAPKKDDSE